MAYTVKKKEIMKFVWSNDLLCFLNNPAIIIRREEAPVKLEYQGCPEG